MEPRRVAVILAAGQGKRMKSGLPKVLHRLSGKCVVEYVIDSARQAGLQRLIMVIGHQGDKVRKALEGSDLEFVVQEQQLGTGHAVMAAGGLLTGFDGDLVVLCGDMPLVKSATIRRLFLERQRTAAAAVVLTAALEDPAGYGRIVRDENGLVRAIVEDRDADNQVRRIREVNTGAYCFQWAELRPALEGLNHDNKQNEYYLTDTIRILVERGKKVGAVTVSDALEGMGVNSLDELRHIESLIEGGTTWQNRV